LTQRRAALISRESMTRLARHIGLGEYLLLGRGEEATNGRSKDANLSGAMESVIAAVYLDGGLEAARSSILDIMHEEIARVTLAVKEIDYKSELQELTQACGQGIPAYRPAGETGPDHERVFTVDVLVEGNSARPERVKVKNRRNAGRTEGAGDIAERGVAAILFCVSSYAF